MPPRRRILPSLARPATPGRRGARRRRLRPQRQPGLARAWPGAATCAPSRSTAAACTSWTSGPAARPPVLFVHGLGGRWQNWLENDPAARRAAPRRRARPAGLRPLAAAAQPISIAGYAAASSALCDLLELESRGRRRQLDGRRRRRRAGAALPRSASSGSCCVSAAAVSIARLQPGSRRGAAGGARAHAARHARGHARAHSAAAAPATSRSRRSCATRR